MEVRLAAATIGDRHGAEAMLVSAVGEDVCLGFANTLAWRGRVAPVETLADFAALLRWAQTSAVPAFRLQPCSRQCCGQQPISWLEARMGAFAAAPTISACGCSSTRARTVRGAGAQWPPAATAPRRAGTT